MGPPRGSFPTLGSSAANAVDSVWSAASSNEVTSRTEKPGGKRLFRSSAAASIAAPFRSRDRMPSPGLTARIAGLSTEAVSWSTTRSETRRLFSPRDAHGRDEAPNAGSEHRMSAVTRLLEGVSHLVRAERAGLRTRLLTLGEARSSTAVPDVGISFSSRSLDGAGDGVGVFLAETNGEGCRIVHHFVFVASFIENGRSLGGAVRGEAGNARELNTGSL